MKKGPMTTFLVLCLVERRFTYDERCPADLTKRLEECKEGYLDDSMLLFDEENDLIAQGRKKDIRRACKYGSLFITL